MGAERPQVRGASTKDQTPLPIVFIWVFLLLIAAAIFLAEEKNEAPVLKPKEKAKLDKRLREIDDSEQYALVAKADGWYPCLHSGKTTCHLLGGEVWKYGVTSKGQFGRYSNNFLLKNKVSYIVEFKGNFAECLKQEQIRLFDYPYLPENLARPLAERLERPPYNSIMR